MGYLYGCRGDARYLQGRFEDALADCEQRLCLGDTSAGTQIHIYFAKEALTRSTPFSDGKVNVDVQGNAALSDYFDGGDIPSSGTMLAYVLFARAQGLPVGGVIFPVLQTDSEGRASANCLIYDGAFVEVPFSEDKQVMGYILYQQYDAPLYPHAAKFADALIAAVCGETTAISYAELKTVQFAQRRWEPLAQTYGD